MSYRIAIDAGHGINTPGKRCDKSIDKNETREWWLNNRIAVYIEEGLKKYSGYELIRTDDRTGKTDVSRTERCHRANAFKADIFCSIHANAASKVFSGGGIVLYVCKGLQENGTTRTLQKDLYNRLIEKTGLKGNRALPLGLYNYDVLVGTNMPAILGELGFMNSTVDTPIILTEEFAKNAAEAYIEFFVENGGLKLKDGFIGEESDSDDSTQSKKDEQKDNSLLNWLKNLIKRIVEWANS